MTTLFLPDVNYDHAPVSYLDHAHPLHAILSGIPTQQRRQLVREWLEQHPNDELPLDLLASRVTQKDRAMGTVLDPMWLGGQFLPPLGARSVEIARVCLRSTTGDVFSLRASWSGARWRYRLDDDYPDLKMGWTLPQQSSRLPLTLRQVIRMIDLAWPQIEGDPTRSLVWGLLDFRLGEGGVDPDFLWVESDIYPDLQRHYAVNIEVRYGEEEEEEDEEEEGWR
jgi:hypothetical protein